MGHGTTDELIACALQDSEAYLGEAVTELAAALFGIVDGFHAYEMRDITGPPDWDIPEAQQGRANWLRHREQAMTKAIERGQKALDNYRG